MVNDNVLRLGEGGDLALLIFNSGTPRSSTAGKTVNTPHHEVAAELKVDAR